MTNNRRVSRVSEAIKREVSQMILHGLRDERVGVGMVSITAVDVSGDLQHAKIFVSIFGSDDARKETMEGLKAVTGQVRSQIGQRVRLRRTPEITFVEDRSFDKAVNVLSILDKLDRERTDKEPEIEVPAAAE
jgi:ribosome-binding factor A